MELIKFGQLYKFIKIFFEDLWMKKRSSSLPVYLGRGVWKLDNCCEGPNTPK